VTTRTPSSVSRLRMRGAILTLPQYVFMVVCLIKHGMSSMRDAYLNTETNISLYD
jgi:hypothetical protein